MGRHTLPTLLSACALCSLFYVNGFSVMPFAYMLEGVPYPLGSLGLFSAIPPRKRKTPLCNKRLLTTLSPRHLRLANIPVIGKSSDGIARVLRTHRRFAGIGREAPSLARHRFQPPSPLYSYYPPSPLLKSPRSRAEGTKHETRLSRAAGAQHRRRVKYLYRQRHWLVCETVCKKYKILLATLFNSPRFPA